MNNCCVAATGSDNINCFACGETHLLFIIRYSLFIAVLFPSVVWSVVLQNSYDPADESRAAFQALS